MSANRKPLRPVSAAGLVLLASGCVAWAWTFEWRWAATGLGAFVVLGVIGAVTDGRKAHNSTNDVVPAHLSSGRSATERGNTISCTECPWTFTHISAARRMTVWSTHSCPTSRQPADQP